MADLTVQQISLAGLINPTLSSAAGGGDTFNNDGNTLFVADNASGGSITLTFNDIGSPAPPGAKSFDADVDVVVPAGQRAYIGPFTTARFGTSCGVSYSGVTSLTVAAFRFK